MKRIALIFAAICCLSGAFISPAAATPPTFSFTQDHGYCEAAFQGHIGARAWLRTFIRDQNNGNGQVVTSAHAAMWSENCNGGGASSGCGSNLDDVASPASRLRIYAVYADGSSTKMEDRTFNLEDSNVCDYVAGSTTDWIINANEVHVRWDFDVKFTGAPDDNSQTFMIWRKVASGNETWGCELNGSLVWVGTGDCRTAGPF